MHTIFFYLHLIASPCGARSVARSDPHLRSVDGRFFDVQELGVFTFCQTSFISIQSCHQPWYPVRRNKNKKTKNKKQKTKNNEINQ